MNASQARVARRATLRAHPLGSAVIMPTGKPATVADVDRLGRSLTVRRGDNRRVAVKLSAL
jgi:hypothetical protein